MTGGDVQPLEAGDPRQVGPFTIEGRLGSGGMGRVFLGRSASGQQVAVKVIHAALGEETQFRQRFRREVQAAARVAGGHAALVVDSDAGATPPWMAVEYIAGPTLQARIENGGAMPAAEVAGLAVGIGRALTAIHEAGLVHRDLKPTNVLLSPNGPRVIDFGIARAADSSTLTRTGVIAGTAGFMSPEQAEAEQVTSASDVFSLGAVLYFAATGLPMFGEGSTPSVMYRVVHAEPDLTRVADPALRDLIGWCTAKDPAQRPSTAQILAAAPNLRDGTWRRSVPAVDDSPTQIRVVPASDGARPGTSWVRRPGVLAGLGLLIVLAIGVPGTVLAMNGSAPASARGHRTAPAPAGAATPSARPVVTPTAPVVPASSAAGTSSPVAPARTPRATSAPVVPADPADDDPATSKPEPDDPAEVTQAPKPKAKADGSVCLGAPTSTSGFDLPDGKGVIRFGPIHTTSACKDIHIKLTSALYRTYARSCLETPSGSSITGCSDYILLSYPDTWDTLSRNVPAGQRWQLQIYANSAETIAFSYTT